MLGKKILDNYDGGAPIFNTNNIYGLASAWTFVEALKRAGNPPTRAGLMKALRSMDYKNNPWLYPGFRVKTTPTDRSRSSSSSWPSTTRAERRSSATSSRSAGSITTCASDARAH